MWAQAVPAGGRPALDQATAAVRQPQVIVVAPKPPGPAAPRSGGVQAPLRVGPARCVPLRWSSAPPCAVALSRGHPAIRRSLSARPDTPPRTQRRRAGTAGGKKRPQPVPPLRRLVRACYAPAPGLGSWRPGSDRASSGPVRQAVALPFLGGCAARQCMLRLRVFTRAWEGLKTKCGTADKGRHGVRAVGGWTDPPPLLCERTTFQGRRRRIGASR